MHIVDANEEKAFACTWVYTGTESVMSRGEIDEQRKTSRAYKWGDKDRKEEPYYKS